MSDTSPVGGPTGFTPWNRHRIRAEDLDHIDPYVLKALRENKRRGLLLAVRARWVAMGIIVAILPILYPTWEVICFEAAAGLFALLGWAQLRADRVESSVPELSLIFCDLALVTFLLLVPNPLARDS